MKVDEKLNVNMNCEVTGKSGKYLEVATIAIDKKGNEYQTIHIVAPAKGMKPKVGEYMHVEGTLDVDDNGINVIEPLNWSMLEDKPKDQRMNAWLTGEATSNFIEPKSIEDVASDKKPFGVATIKVGNRFQRGIVFNQLIPVFRKNLKAGAIFKMAGRLQYRTFVDKDDNERTVCEVICDNNYTQILKASTKKNPFAFSSEDVMSGFKKAEEVSV